LSAAGYVQPIVRCHLSAGCKSHGCVRLTNAHRVVTVKVGAPWGLQQHQLWLDQPVSPLRWPPLPFFPMTRRISDYVIVRRWAILICHKYKRRETSIRYCLMLELLIRCTVLADRSLQGLVLSIEVRFLRTSRGAWASTLHRHNQSNTAIMIA